MDKLPDNPTYRSLFFYLNSVPITRAIYWRLSVIYLGNGLGLGHVFHEAIELLP
jgi:hypothetical protein